VFDGRAKIRKKEYLNLDLELEAEDDVT
jgi:hypothetical protein